MSDNFLPWMMDWMNNFLTTSLYQLPIFIKGVFRDVLFKGYLFPALGLIFGALFGVVCLRWLYRRVVSALRK